MWRGYAVRMQSAYSAWKDETLMADIKTDVDGTNDASDDHAVAETGDSGPWLKDIEDAEKAFEQYQEKCDNIDKLYANLEQLAGVSTDREMQVFWANLEVLKPSIYARAPVPVVVPRYKDQRELPRVASQLLERNLATSFEMEDIDQTMLQLRDDLATNARGAPWLRYETEGGGANGEQYYSEKVCYDHVDRCDFLHEPARKWKEVGWVARRSWLTKEQGDRRFPGKKFGESASFVVTENDTDDEYKREKKAPVWEIWSKTRRKVVWVTSGIEETLDEQLPYLNLRDFYPCPRPAYGTTQRRSLIPVPDFLQYKDQLEEINELTARISALSEALRMKGFYAGGVDDLSDAIESAIRNIENNAILIPVPNMAAMGGASLKDSIIWLPVREVAETVQALLALRKEVIADVYEITGLSDIMRGATDPNETLGAQQLKSQYGSVRIRDRQSELVRIARDMARMAGEIMSENFKPETLLMNAQMELPTEADIEQQIQAAAADPNNVAMALQNPQAAQQLIQEARETVTIDKIVALFRSERVRPFALDIETDSTIQPDENADKQRRAEFLTALGNTMAQMAPMVQAQPQTAGFAGEILKFAIAPFRAGRELEQAVDDFVEQMKQFSQPEQEQPDPAQMKMQADMQIKQADAELRQKEAQADAERDQQKQVQDLEHKRQLHELDMEAKRLDLEIKQAESDMKMGAAALQAGLKIDQEQQKVVTNGQNS